MTSNIVEGMYVKCFYDFNTEYHRNFLCGKVRTIDPITKKVYVEFLDTNGIKKINTDIISGTQYNIFDLQHISIKKGAKVKTNDNVCAIVKSSYLAKNGFFYYYLETNNGEIIRCSECDLIASCNDFEPDPLTQLKKYEFQNPGYFFDRYSVIKNLNIINNLMSGFEELCSCKIHLKDYQLKTVMRCLESNNCRYMIADEVGLGKTIEALSILKVFLSRHSKQNACIFVPGSIISQWRTEMAFKFNLFEGKDHRDNVVLLKPLEELELFSKKSIDFVIIDEVHHCLTGNLYTNIISISRNAKNILLLSATPIQARTNDYRKLLITINPNKYLTFGDVFFNTLLLKQQKVNKQIYLATSDLNTFERCACDGDDIDNLQDCFESVINHLERIALLVENENLLQRISMISFNDENHGIPNFQKLISYICDTYQLDELIIRSRRNVLADDASERRVEVLPYFYSAVNNQHEENLYRRLIEWIQDENVVDVIGIDGVCNILCSFFSSVSALESVLSSYSNLKLPALIGELISELKQEEQKKVKQFEKYMDSTEECDFNRMQSIINYLDKNLHNYGKAVLFTNYLETFDLYKKAIVSYFGKEKCAFFNSTMDEIDLEQNVYVFQDKPECQILLCDASGGEGRNFQMANVVVHIDIPFSAMDIEQRIGRLDRVGRPSDFDVISVVPYAEDTLESDLFKIWNEGLCIFTKSQCGLEIIMDEIDADIKKALSSDLLNGLYKELSAIIEKISKINKEVELEKVFDISKFRYSSINGMINSNLKKLANCDTDLFSNSMLSWAKRVGLKCERKDDGTVIFSPNKFDPYIAKEAYYLPPRFKAVLDNKLNLIRNRVRVLTGKDEMDVKNTIQGTFSRKNATNNDYLYFFAPGDPFYDSIVENAMNSFYGVSSSFVAEGCPITWNGLIFIWKLKINENLLYKEGIDTRILNHFKPYLPAESITSCVEISGDKLDDDIVITNFERIISKEITPSKIYDMGSRRDRNHKKEGPSMVSGFIKKYPKDVWDGIVSDSYEKAYRIAKRKLEEYSNKIIERIKIEVTDLISRNESISYYSTNNLNNSITEGTASLIVTLFNELDVKLDSCTYIYMKQPK